MKNTILAGAIAAFVAGAAGVAVAQDFSGKVGVEMTDNAANDFVATPVVELSFGHKTADATFFGGIGVEANATDEIVLDTWYVGVNFGATAVSFGDQGDLFDFGGLEVVGGETLANPADDHESLIVRHREFAAFVGFTDIGTDAGDVENVQLAYAKDFGTFNLVSAVDYNVNAEAFVLAVAADSNVTETINLATTLTYDDAASLLAYEAKGTYEHNENFEFAGYFNGDEVDAFQNVGVGVVYTKETFEAFAEVGYNVDTDEATPAVGVSFSF